LSTGHTGPHEFVGADSVVYQWETDLECECSHCMRCEGDYCATYWLKDSAQAAQDGDRTREQAEAEQRERLSARPKRLGPATADFDLPAPNDDLAAQATTPSPDGKEAS
jgi:hypothetical protein